MNFKLPTALAIAAVLIALPSSGFARTADPQPNDVQPSQAAQSTSSSSATQVAAKMVSGLAVFTSEIDARKTQPGAQFQAKLLKKVQLEGGPELPAGTRLVGQIVTDDTQSTGSAKLALRFSQANLKNGQTVPIKATIVDAYHVPDDFETQYGEVDSPQPWDHQSIRVDQIGALSGVDLHSNITSPNSGVFVSTKKDDIKLSTSIGVELAIAPQAIATQASAGGE